MSTSRRVIVAVNPHAAFGKHGAVGAQVSDALTSAGFGVMVLQEPTFDQLQQSVARAITTEPAALIVVGGDGMVSLGVNALAQSSIPLGIVPTGTGNDFARGLGIPVTDRDDAIRALLGGMQREPRKVDLGKITLHSGETRWFAGVLSAGFDALVNERANRLRWPKGPLRYVIALLAELASLKTRRYTISIDGSHRIVHGVLISVANNAFMGGGMRVVPHASITDGMLDVFIGHSLGRAQLLRVFPKVYAGTHTSHPAVEFARGKHISIDAAGVTAYADGERVGGLPLTIEVAPGALTVVNERVVNDRDVPEPP